MSMHNHDSILTSTTRSALSAFVPKGTIVQWYAHLQVAAVNKVAVHMYEKCGYSVISCTADHPLHWIMRHVLKSFLGYPDWNMMGKRLMTSKGSKATHFTPVRIPISITAASGSQALPPIPEGTVVKDPIKAAFAADCTQPGAAAKAPHSKPRVVFSFTSLSPTHNAKPSWVMDIGDDDGEEDRILEAACAAGELAESAQNGAADKTAARRALSVTLPTVTEWAAEDDDEELALERGSAMLPRRRGLARLPSFKLPGVYADALGSQHSRQRRPLTRTNTM